MSNETVGIIVQVPEGDYCAKFFDMEGVVENLTTGEKYPNIVLIDVCPLLKICRHGIETGNVKQRSYYCPIANNDCHCGQDEVGILKQSDYYDSICPSLYQSKIMNLIRKIGKNI